MKIITHLCLIIFLSTSTLVSSQDSCSSRVLQLDRPYPFDTTILKCSSVWEPHNFILRYGRASSNVWSFIFSFPSSINAYAAIGFSNDGKMVKSSAIVGWISGLNGGGMNQYYLGGLSDGEVVPGEGDLYVMNETIIRPNPSIVYMIFQLKTNQPSSKLIYSIGPNGVFPDTQGMLQQHSDAISTVIDYSQGETSEVSYLKLRRSHGVINMTSWSILMIMGYIIARHFKKWDPIWFYLHASIQTISFVAGTAGILIGYALSKKVDANVNNHKNIAIIILVLGILQVFAIILRPKPESKLRKYWNWYHHYVGRILIIFAIANTIYGLSLAKEGSKWFLAYGVSIAILVIINIILEVRMWIIARRKTQSTNNSSHPQSLEFAYQT